MIESDNVEDLGSLKVAWWPTIYLFLFFFQLLTVKILSWLHRPTLCGKAHGLQLTASWDGSRDSWPHWKFCRDNQISLSAFGNSWLLRNILKTLVSEEFKERWAGTWLGLSSSHSSELSGSSRWSEMPWNVVKRDNWKKCELSLISLHGVTPPINVDSSTVTAKRGCIVELFPMQSPLCLYVLP